MSYANLGVVQMKQDKLQDAENSFKKALELDKDLNSVRFDYAVLLDKSNKTALAIEQYKMFIEHYPDNVNAYINLANLYSKNSDYVSAIDTLEKARKLKPDNTFIQFELARMYQNNAEFNDALKYYNDVLATDKLNYIALYNKAVVLSQLGQYQLADTIYNQLLKLDENELSKNNVTLNDVNNDRIDNLIKMADNYYQLAEYKKANSLYQKLLTEMPDDYRALIGLADSSLALGMNTFAKDYYEKAILIDNTNAQALSHYAQALYELKDFETADAVLDKAIECDSDDDKLYYNKALIEYELKKLDLALVNIKKASILKPLEADYFYLEGLILEADNNPKDSIFAYEKYIELSQDENLKSQVQAKVKTLYDSLVQ